ncbi:ferredoxin reductase domain-containing protein [Winogradskyella jejuensis]|uniref:FAD-binding FR-type domain-containing protein n=1 Tax=Winogradskyella jejuensis TaxID=1089305 RepID=A0A1M5UC80_9FLAO|nr:flavodoxin reductase [Winogradskyella jejuensis]SHH60528.1 hypothetical protein SAMN05444148_2432 [Winogradskyella jejuensis]
MEHQITIEQIEHINHNVIRIITSKPSGYSFSPGQATEMAIDKDGYREKKRPFTFTSLPEDNKLEFTIKVYNSHNGVTDELETLKVDDKLIIGDAWGAISYKGEGTFIAGGAGVTPFIAILKDLQRKGELKNQKLLCSNKKEKDIILKNNFEAWLGNNATFILSEENHSDYYNGHIDKQFLKSQNLDISKPVYLCGPPAMESAVKTDLYAMGLSENLLITEA